HGHPTVAVAPDGSLYVSDASPERVRRVLPNGLITTVAGGGIDYPGDGGPATAAFLVGVTGFAFGSDSSLYIADQYDHRVRRVDPQGIITTVAGDGTANFSGDGGPAAAAQLN